MQRFENRWKACGLTACVLLVSRVLAAAAPADWQEVAPGQMDTQALNDRGRAVLAAPEFKWQHAQTPHFVVHFENGIFAAKVARMAEFFHAYIAADLKGVEDRLGGRSHIFIFRNAKDWNQFRAAYAPDVPGWTFSFVHGPLMFLQQAENTGSSAEVLAHEMTHLVVNRFFLSRLPTWLNEGVAEWYGEFAYAEFKGIKKSKKAQFKKLQRMFPLDRLFSSTGYPEDPYAVSSYYETAKYVVAFLQFRQPADDFTALLQEAAGMEDAVAPLLARYRFASQDEFTKAFLKFAR